MSGGADGGHWDPVAGLKNYVVQYTKDNYKTVLNFSVSSNNISLYNVDSGQYKWRVGCYGSPEWTSGEVFSAVKKSTSKLLSAKQDEITDIFFGNANGIWGGGYAAKHIGSLDGWNGTEELIYLYGKNKIADVFNGSNDANILVLTDGTNGDALFVDDIYTSLGDQARLSQIDEIRAGAGDDIVDMTSRRFEYVGAGVKIYGGNGNDTIWANRGSNTLFGDAGNDRLVGGTNNDVIVGGIGNDSMHGGGGEDLFCFGGDKWGIDTIEQLAGGKVTLWFAKGSISNWNASTLTYVDGKNSVNISGVSSSDISLIFGDDNSPLYDELSAIGCFVDITSEKIFEDKNRGMLA